MSKTCFRLLTAVGLCPSYTPDTIGDLWERKGSNLSFRPSQAMPRYLLFMQNSKYEKNNQSFKGWYFYIALMFPYKTCGFHKRQVW